MVTKQVRESIERWFVKNPRATFYERIQLQEEGMYEYADLPFSQRYGKVLRYILSGMTLVIGEGEHIVGGIEEIVPSEELRRCAEELSSNWWDGISEEEKQQRILFYYSPGWIKRRDPRFFSLGHLAFDWETILTKGLGWYAEKARGLLASGTFTGDPQKTDFLEGAILAYEAQSAFIQRYGETADILAAAAIDDSDRKRLLAVRDICFQIATKPARTFHEALQLIWFIVLISQKVAGCGVFCFSRMDQYLYPYYSRDLAAGTLTREHAHTLIVEFFNKNNDIMSPTDHMSQETDATRNNLEVTYDDPNYLIVGGRLDAEHSGVNDLSFLLVEATHDLGLRNPFLVVRWHEGIDGLFWKNVCSALRDNATIVVYNDDTMLPALQSYGVEKQDAYSYGFYGCNDPLIPGKEGGLRQLWFNLAWPLELALFNGRPAGGSNGSPSDNYALVDRLIGLMTGPYYGIRDASSKEPATMEEFFELYRRQMFFLLNQFRELMEADYAREAVCNAGRLRFEDLYLEGTIDAAEDWVTGGVKYHKITMQGSGLATVIDSLAALDRAVFIDKRYTLAELREALRCNFGGYGEMRRYLHTLPKYGNDVDSVDRYGKIVADIYADGIRMMNIDRRGLYSYMPCISTDRDFTGMGKSLAATPDGRMAGEPIGENQSPYMGADMNGATALLNSVSKLPFHRYTGGPLNVMLHPSSIEGEAGLENLMALFRVYLKRGGMQVQLNVAGRETLMDAQRNPVQYRNLCVRVTGYAAYFTQMGKIAQDELIHRTVH